jgi:hypothetical protein
MTEKPYHGVEMVGGPYDGEVLPWPAVPVRGRLVALADLREGDSISLVSPPPQERLDELRSSGPLNIHDADAMKVAGEEIDEAYQRGCIYAFGGHRDAGATIVARMVFAAERTIRGAKR